jgi:molecular chaperone GrpE
MHSKQDNHKHGGKTPEARETPPSTPEEAVDPDMADQARPETAEPAADSREELGEDALSNADFKVEGQKGLDPQTQISELEGQIADLNDKFLRKAADFENLRKRTIKEKEEARLYATTELLVDLVSLLDDFDRAIQSSETGKDWKSLHDGVSMIQKAFLGKLEGRYGLKRYDSAGEPFDPARHEALMAEQREGLEAPVVIEDFMKGYILHDRIIRPAKVKVAMPAQSAATRDSPDSGDGAAAGAGPGASGE